MAASGAVTISLDFELAWGLRDRPAERRAVLSTDRRAESAYLDRFLNLCDRLEIPVTFATVGHLFLDECSGAHPEVGADRGLDGDPGTDRDADPLFYAPDLIERIRGAAVDHEVATHTFSHAICDSVPRDVVDRELRAAADRHVDCGLDAPRTLVAPRNRLPDYDVLRGNDIRTVRVPRPRPADSELGRYARRARSWTIDETAPVGAVAVERGVVEQYSTPYPSLTAVHLSTGRAEPLAPFRVVPRAVRQRIHEAYLTRTVDLACEAAETAHLWSHLYNLANEAQWPPIESFLRTVAARRDDGDLRVRTMGEAAARVDDASIA